MPTLYLFLLLSLLRVSSKTDPIIPHARHAYTVISHRGNHVNAPENTLIAYEEAIRVGADYIEVDVRTSKDGQLVVMHDGNVERTTTSKGKVSDFTAIDFTSLQIRDERFPLLPALHPPTFEDVLRMAKGRIHLYIDDKDADPAKVAVLLQKYQMDTCAVVYTSLNKCKLWKKALPHIASMVSLPKSITQAEALAKFLEDNPVDILDGGVTGYTPELVNAAHKLGALVWPDIQNPGENPDQWNVPIKMGIKALQTDHPEELIKYLQSLGIR